MNIHRGSYRFMTWKGYDFCSCLYVVNGSTNLVTSNLLVLLVTRVNSPSVSFTWLAVFLQIAGIQTPVLFQFPCFAYNFNCLFTSNT